MINLHESYVSKLGFKLYTLCKYSIYVNQRVLTFCFFPSRKFCFHGDIKIYLDTTLYQELWIIFCSTPKSSACWGKNSADNKIKKKIISFSQKIGFDISCKLPPFGDNLYEMSKPTSWEKYCPFVICWLCLEGGKGQFKNSCESINCH